MHVKALGVEYFLKIEQEFICREGKLDDEARNRRLQPVCFAGFGKLRSSNFSTSGQSSRALKLGVTGLSLLSV